MTAPIHVAITGAAGQIGYAMTFRIACGEVFGAESARGAAPDRGAARDGGARRRAHGTRRLCVSHAGRRRQEGQRPSRRSVRRLQLGAARRQRPPEAGNGTVRPDPHQRADLHQHGQGDQRRRGEGRPRRRRRQSVQHELPDRHVPRPERAPRPLVRHDAARSEPGRVDAGAESRPAGRVGDATWRSGETTRRRSIPIS